MELLESVDHDTFQYSKIPEILVFGKCAIFVAFSHNLSILWSWIRLFSSFIQIFPPPHVSTRFDAPAFRVRFFLFWSASSAWSRIGHGFRARANFGSTHPPSGCILWVFGLHRQHGHGLVMDFELHHGLVRLTIDFDNSRVSWNKF